MATVSVLNQNQFAQTPVIGEQDLTVNQNIVEARIWASSVSAAPLVAGQAFALVDQPGSLPIVDVAAITAKAWGVAIHNMKGDTFVKGQAIELALVGSTIYLETAGAIARGARVQLTPTGPTITTATLGTNASIGYAVDKATATGQLIRVYIQPESIGETNY